EVTVKVNFNLGKNSRDMVERLQVAIHESVSSGAPVIQSVTNPTVGTPDTVNAGDMVVIHGLNVAVEGDQTADIGVFFTPLAGGPAGGTGGGSAIHIPAGKFSPNTPGQVQFALPAAVTPGEWTVRLATQTTGRKGQFVKEARSFTYATPVQVL
ncbi:MAG: DUF4469 domain-containing protein, partial [Treponema sp.]|nr:DUF4469 domain-containing protein [Treponema sp.]